MSKAKNDDHTPKWILEKRAAEKQRITDRQRKLRETGGAATSLGISLTVIFILGPVVLIAIALLWAFLTS
jgi:hypothetical protein